MGADDDDTIKMKYDEYSIPHEQVTFVKLKQDSWLYDSVPDYDDH